LGPLAVALLFMVVGLIADAIRRKEGQVP
jgi:hypothetical protein